MPFHCESEERLYFTRVEQAFDRLKDRWVLATVPFTAELARTPPHVRPAFRDRPRDGYQAVREGDAWGADWSTGWFHLRGEVPAAWAGRTVVAWIEINGEGLLYDRDGKALQGITNGSVFDHWASRPIMPLFAAANGGEQVELAVVMRAEKEACTVIRLVETRGLRSAATVRLAKPGRLVPCDLLEWKDGEAGATAAEHRVELAPFEIRTYKLR
jgi:alpha-mannosidase